MKERPILFSAPMVRAILEGRKTQTRRTAKPRKLPSLLEPGEWSDAYILDPGNRQWLMRDCRFGDPGDRLWVRETWAVVHDSHPFVGDANALRDAQRKMPWASLAFRASPHDGAYAEEHRGRWRPSIHMPRWASRLTLEVVSVRVERLQDISEEDAIAEGIERGDDFFQCPTWKDYLSDGDGPTWFPDDPIGSYRSLWESINGAGSWDANPWVWVVEFKVVE